MSFTTGIEYMRAEALYHLIRACTDEAGNPQAPSEEALSRARDTIPFWFPNEMRAVVLQEHDGA
jgi:hypothetical protein